MYVCMDVCTCQSCVCIISSAWLSLWFEHSKTLNIQRYGHKLDIKGVISVFTMLYVFIFIHDIYYICIYYMHACMLSLRISIHVYLHLLYGYIYLHVYLHLCPALHVSDHLYLYLYLYLFTCNVYHRSSSIYSQTCIYISIHIHR